MEVNASLRRDIGVSRAINHSICPTDVCMKHTLAQLAKDARTFFGILIIELPLPSSHHAVRLFPGIYPCAIEEVLVNRIAKPVERFGVATADQLAINFVGGNAQMGAR